MLPLITYSSQARSAGCLGCSLCASLLYVSNADKLQFGPFSALGSYFMPHNQEEGGLEHSSEQGYEEYEKAMREEAEEKREEGWVSHMWCWSAVSQEWESKR